MWCVHTRLKAIHRILGLILVGQIVYAWFIIHTIYSHKPQQEVESTQCNRTSKPLKPSKNDLLDSKIETNEMNRYLPYDLLTTKNSTDVEKWRRNECGRFPNIWELAINNKIWQHFHVDNQSLYLLGAYHDNRPASGSVVRIILGAKKSNRVPKYKCSLWVLGREEPVLVDVALTIYTYGVKFLVHQHPEYHYSHLATCPIPSELKGQIPVAVSFVDHPCNQATNVLKVYNSIPPTEPRRGVGVCVKSLFWPNLVSKLHFIEWIETTLALGARKIHIYYIYVPKEILAVMNYYKNRGVLEPLIFTWPGHMPTSPKMQSFYYNNVEHLAGGYEQYVQNDCFYQNIYQYEFVTLLDVDELIVPKEADNWAEMLNNVATHWKLAKEEIDVMFFFHYYFFGNNTKDLDLSLPNAHRFLDADIRSESHLGEKWQVKAMFNTRTVMIVFNHYPMGCIDRPLFTWCKHRSFAPISIAQLNHYRDDCHYFEVMTEELCEAFKLQLVEDKSLKRFEPHVKRQMAKVLAKLDFE